MEYEDDEYDQYQQYEDELYKDASEESESNDEVDSELEDNMLARIHYSTNVYKRVGSNASKSSEGQTANGSVNNIDLADNHLAAPPTAAEDYFNSVNQENEQDSDNDEGIANASTHANNQDVTNITTTNMNGNYQKNVDPDEEHGESRYNVEKKGASKNNWNQHAIAVGNSPSKGTNGDEDGSDESDTSDEEGAITGEEAADRVNFAEKEIKLDQHVIDLGAPLDDIQEEVNDYDLNAELGHLDDEEFKDCNRQRPSYSNKRAGSAFSSQSRARLIFQGSPSPKADNNNNKSASKSISSSSFNRHSSSSRHDSRSDKHGNDHRSSSSRRDRDYNDDYHRGSRSQSHSRDGHRRGDYRDNRNDNYSYHAREEEQRRQRAYRDLDHQRDSGSRYDQDHERDDQEQLNEYAEYSSQQDRGNDRRNKRKKPRNDSRRDDESNNRSKTEGRTGHSSSSAMAPTTATGANLADNHLGNTAASSSHSRSGASIASPIVITDSPSNSPRPQHRSHNPNDRNQGRIPGGGHGSSNRQSFADQNAFPRNNRGNNSDERNGLMGVPPRSPGPLYTGGYNRRR
ncbi:hypothetical protein BGX21_004152 [Mortierella sp. AD011]|nr:hypothetical protein BGX20_009249 [Mortierella sp. AD010]KAF9400498.1 hypothetical protein BGX21_004152 [Mortierella sp. AD011]